MKGFVPTPSELVDEMVGYLFREAAPASSDLVLDPGCGRGEFIAGILRWCEAKGTDTPTIIGVENDPKHWAPAHSRFLGNAHVKIRRRDFLNPDPTSYDYVVGNPPYVPITGLSQEEKDRFRRAGFQSATGRMDLYLLFFEAALNRLRPGGRLVFVTPEKFLYVATAAPIRRLLASMDVDLIKLHKEDLFPGRTAYPAVTCVSKRPASGPTTFVLRDGTTRTGSLPSDGSSWLPLALGAEPDRKGPTLDSVAVRISPGIATGAEGVFVLHSEEVPRSVRNYARPTVAGRDLRPGAPNPVVRDSMLIPYSKSGKLMNPRDLRPLLEYLSDPTRRARLEERTCVARKPWYAFHDSAPMPDILKPKILWKDISAVPEFWPDRSGTLVPRHTVYYLTPKDPARFNDILDYLQSDEAVAWIKSHCQRAANGFLRMQSEVLRDLPVPQRLMRRGTGAPPSSGRIPRTSAGA
jgi:SAM-dependent methyltransferase